MSDTFHRGLVDDFADLWLDRTTVPDVWSFLRDHPFAVRPEVVEVLLADQWRRHELGCPRPVEEYLSEPTIAANHEWKLDLVYGEYRAASRFATPPDLTALAARFPDLADALRRHVEVEALLTPTGAAPLERTGRFLQTGAVAPIPEFTLQLQVFWFLAAGNSPLSGVAERVGTPHTLGPRHR